MLSKPKWNEKVGKLELRSQKMENEQEPRSVTSSDFIEAIAEIKQYREVMRMSFQSLETIEYRE